MNSLVLSLKARIFMLFLLLYYTASPCETSDHHCLGKDSTSCVIGFYEERDLELFNSCNHTHHGIFSSNLDKNLTSFGKSRLVAHLKNPTVNSDLLRLRQKQLSLILDNPVLLGQLESVLAEIGRNQEGLIAFMDTQANPFVQKSLDNFYFKIGALKRFNNAPVALDALNYFKYLTLLAPVLEHLVFHFAANHVEEKMSGPQAHVHGDSCSHGPCVHHMKAPANASSMVKGGIALLKIGHFVLHAASFKEMAEQMSSEKAIINELHSQVGMAQSALKGIKKLYSLMTDHGYCPEAFGLPATACAYFDGSSEDQKALTGFIDDVNFNASDSIGFFSRIGSTLSYYRLLKAQATILQNLTQPVGDLDALVSIARWYRQVNTHQKRACLVNFIDAAHGPFIEMKQCWNLAFDSRTAVTNDLLMNRDDRSMIITGLNKAGKSSILKMVGLNVILSQVYGIAAAQEMNIVPFDKLISHLIVADDISAGESTMVSEMIRADRCLHAVQQLGPQQYACVLVDDSLFKGTTEEKRHQLAEEFIRGLGAQDSCCSMIATHLPCLTTFALEPNSPFKNYCIDVSVDSQRRTYSTYKLVEGVSNFNAVFDIVHSEGYKIGR